MPLSPVNTRPSTPLPESNTPQPSNTPRPPSPSDQQTGIIAQQALSIQIATSLTDLTNPEPGTSSQDDNKNLLDLFQRVGAAKNNEEIEDALNDFIQGAIEAKKLSPDQLTEEDFKSWLDPLVLLLKRGRNTQEEPRRRTMSRSTAIRSRSLENLTEIEDKSSSWNDHRRAGAITRELWKTEQALRIQEQTLIEWLKCLSEKADTTPLSKLSLSIIEPLKGMLPLLEQMVKLSKTLETSFETSYQKISAFEDKEPSKKNREELTKELAEVVNCINHWKFTDYPIFWEYITLHKKFENRKAQYPQLHKILIETLFNEAVKNETVVKAYITEQTMTDGKTPMTVAEAAKQLGSGYDTLLIPPVQRAPRYLLLFDQILRVMEKVVGNDGPSDLLEQTKKSVDLFKKQIMNRINSPTNPAPSLTPIVSAVSQMEVYSDAPVDVSNKFDDRVARLKKGTYSKKPVEDWKRNLYENLFLTHLKETYLQLVENKFVYVKELHDEGFHDDAKEGLDELINLVDRIIALPNKNAFIKNESIPAPFKPLIDKMKEARLTWLLKKETSI